LAHPVPVKDFYSQRSNTAMDYQPVDDTHPPPPPSTHLSVDAESNTQSDINGFYGGGGLQY